MVRSARPVRVGHEDRSRRLARAPAGSRRPSPARAPRIPCAGCDAMCRWSSVASISRVSRAVAPSSQCSASFRKPPALPVGRCFPCPRTRHSSRAPARSASRLARALRLVPRPGRVAGRGPTGSQRRSRSDPGVAILVQPADPGAEQWLPGRSRRSNAGFPGRNDESTRRRRRQTPRGSAARRRRGRSRQRRRERRTRPTDRRDPGECSGCREQIAKVDW